MNITEELLKKGYLISPTLVDKIDINKMNKILPKITKKELVITEQLIEYLTKERNINIIRENKQTSAVKRISDFVDFYNKRLEFLRKILEDKIQSKNITSINKLSYGTETTLIGMIREIRDDKFKLEDSTGFISCYYSGTVLEDDVVGVKGIVKKEGFVVDKIYYPDVFLTHTPNYTKDDCSVLFTETLKKPSREPSFIFTFNVNIDPRELKTDIITSDNKKTKIPNVHVFNEPFLVDVNGVMIFVLKIKNKKEMMKKLKTDDPKNMITALIKRRHFLPFEYVEGDPYLIREIPDVIFISGMNEPFFMNYKGISIVSVADGKSFLINLKNRDVEECKD